MKNFIIKPLLLIAIMSMFVFTACKDDEPEPDLKGDFELVLKPTAGGAAFQNGLVLENIKGQKYSPSRFLMYLSKIILVKESGEELLLSEVELFDLGNGGQANKTSHSEGAFALFEDIPAGNYKGIKFGVGVHKDFNPGTQPADYAQGHPLANGAMHWAWASGYRFMVFEGKGDPKNTGTLDHPLVYHSGLQSLYREKEYLQPDHGFTISDGGELPFIIEIDVNRMFYTANDTIDMETQNATHTTPEGSDAYKLAEKVVNNLVNGAMFKIPF